MYFKSLSVGLAHACSNDTRSMISQPNRNMVSYSAYTTHKVTTLHMVYHSVHLLWSMCVMIDHKERVGLAQNLIIH